MHRLGRRDRRVGVAHGGSGDHAAFDNGKWFYAKECRFPHHQIGQFADFYRTHHMRNTMRDGGVDGVFGDIAFDTEVVVTGGIFCQRTALDFHFMRGLPGADNHLTNTAHGLRVGGHHGKRAQVMENIFGSDGFAADTAFRKRNILGNGRIQMVADHKHIEMLIYGIDREWPRRIGGRRQYVGIPSRLDNIGCMAATGAFRVEGVDGTVFERAYGGFNKTGLI